MRTGVKVLEHFLRTTAAASTATPFLNETQVCIIFLRWGQDFRGLPSQAILTSLCLAHACPVKASKCRKARKCSARTKDRAVQSHSSSTSQASTVLPAIQNKISRQATHKPHEPHHRLSLCFVCALPTSTALKFLAVISGVVIAICCALTAESLYDISDCQYFRSSGFGCRSLLLLPVSVIPIGRGLLRRG